MRFRYTVEGGATVRHDYTKNVSISIWCILYERQFVERDNEIKSSEIITIWRNW